MRVGKLPVGSEGKISASNNEMLSGFPEVSMIMQMDQESPWCVGESQNSYNHSTERGFHVGRIWAFLVRAGSRQTQLSVIIGIYFTLVMISTFQKKGNSKRRNIATM